MVGRIRVSRTFAAGQRSEIAWYKVLWAVSLPGLGIGVIGGCHIDGIWHVFFTEKLKRAVMYSITLGSRCLKWRMLSLSGPDALLFLQLFCSSLPTPLTLASGGSQIFPLEIHQRAYPSIWPAVPSLQRGLSTNPGVTMWCVCGCSWRDDVCRVGGYYRGGIVVMDVIWRRICVCMILGRIMPLFWVEQGCDEWAGDVYLQSC